MMKLNQKSLIITIIALIILIILLFFSGCNYQVVDMQYNFNRAMIRLPDGTVVEGKLDYWRDYEESDQIQVKIDGVVYLVHSNNCVLISNKGETTP